MVVSTTILKHSVWCAVGALIATGIVVDSFNRSTAEPPVPNPISRTVYIAQSHNTDELSATNQKATLTAQYNTSVKQGDVLRITLKNIPAEMKQPTAWLAAVKAPLFYREKTNTYEGLMPVKVAQKMGGYTIKIQDYNGKTIHTGKVEVTNGGYSRQNIQVSSSMKGHSSAEPGELETISRLKKETGDTLYWSEPLVRPTEDCMNSRFGNLRYHNNKFTGNYHKGIDLRSPQGRPVKATTGGKVKIARTYRLHGGTVGLDHGQGMSSVYIHLSQILVKPGDIVEKGQVVGKVGSTGFATGPHLHWGLFINGHPVNPQPWVHHKSC